MAAMRSVFQASTGIEAHMIKHLLALEEIEAEVFGEHLQGGVGDLQAIGIVRVMVADHDFEQARQIIDDWESQQPPVSVEPTASDSRGFLNIGSLLLGFVLAVIVMLAYLNTPTDSQAKDTNDDGITDQEFFYSAGTLQRAEYDDNYDGRVDSKYFYDMRGALKSSRADSDFDGIFDYHCHYENQTTTGCNYDSDGNGFDEQVELYRFGNLHTRWFYDSQTKRPVKKQVFSGIALKSAKLDTDADGELDTNIVYDEFEEVEMIRSLKDNDDK